MEDVRRVALSLEQAVGESPGDSGTGNICLTSAVVDNGARAAACYRTGENPKEHVYWVSYMEDADLKGDWQTKPNAVEGGGGEEIRTPEGYVLRYLRSFRGDQAGFRAGIDYAFFARSLRAAPTESSDEDPPDPYILREHDEGKAAIEKRVLRRALRSLYDEMLGAEEAAELSSSEKERDSWGAIEDQARERIQNLQPEQSQRAADLRFHRYRRAAEAADAAEAENSNGRDHPEDT